MPQVLRKQYARCYSSLGTGNLAMAMATCRALSASGISAPGSLTWWAGYLTFASLWITLRHPGIQ